ncbi:unnamed protein product, partial [Darwinula stevensoni]
TALAVKPPPSPPNSTREFSIDHVFFVNPIERAHVTFLMAILIAYICLIEVNFEFNVYEVPSMNRGPWSALYLHNYCTSYGYRGGLCYDPVYCWY